MKRFVVAAVVGIGLLTSGPPSGAHAQAECGPWKFADYHMQGDFEFPSTFTGDPFELSQDYPTLEPTYAADEYGWLAVDAPALFRLPRLGTVVNNAPNGLDCAPFERAVRKGAGNTNG